jgi:putative transposase
VKGRKRHLLVDTLGLVQEVLVHSADLQDRDGARLLLEKIKEERKARFPRLKRIWADGGYSGDLVDWVAETLGCELEIVGKPKDQKGFQVLPRRWVVERTFSWFGKYRRLSKDYEAIPQSEEAAIFATMIHLMVRRLCPPKPT